MQIGAILFILSDVTRILSRIEQGDHAAAEYLLPLVYDELRKLAAARLATEKPGQTLQATALVHEAYLRLVDQNKMKSFNGRGLFFRSSGGHATNAGRARSSEKRPPKNVVVTGDPSTSKTSIR